jgi:hypothetical protein
MDKKTEDRMEICERNIFDETVLEEIQTQLSALEITYPYITATNEELFGATALIIKCYENACGKNDDVHIFVEVIIFLSGDKRLRIESFL